MMSITFVRTIFGIPSGPGALYGLRERARHLICSWLILGSGAASSGNPRKSGSGRIGGGLGGKNASDSAVLFCSLVSANNSCLFVSVQ